MTKIDVILFPGEVLFARIIALHSTRVRVCRRCQRQVTSCTSFFFPWRIADADFAPLSLLHSPSLSRMLILDGTQLDVQERRRGTKWGADLARGTKHHIQGSACTEFTLSHALASRLTPAHTTNTERIEMLARARLLSCFFGSFGSEPQESRPGSVGLGTEAEGW